MNCPICKTELLIDAAYCHRCGCSTVRPRRRVRTAGFWRRVLAFLLDVLILSPAILLLRPLLLLPHPGNEPDALEQIFVSGPGDAERAQFQQIREFSRLVEFSFFLCAAYFIFLESSSMQATLGKRLLRLKVTDLNYKKIRRGRAVGRYSGKLLSGAVFDFGFIMAGFTSKKQALHDMLAGTLVIVDESEDKSAPPRR